MVLTLVFFLFFFFNDTATTEIYTLSLHDALPILRVEKTLRARQRLVRRRSQPDREAGRPRREEERALIRSAVQMHFRRHKGDRKSTRLNSSHGYISYAVFCLKKKKKPKNNQPHNR